MGRTEYQRTLNEVIVNTARNRIGEPACDHSGRNCPDNGVNCVEFTFEVVASALIKVGRIDTIPENIDLRTCRMFDSSFWDMGYKTDWRYVQPGNIFVVTNPYTTTHTGVVEKVYWGYNPLTRNVEPFIDGIDSPGICGEKVRRRRGLCREITVPERPNLEPAYEYTLHAIRIAPYNLQTGWHEV